MLVETKKWCCLLAMCVAAVGMSEANAGLVAWWNLNDGSGTTAADSSPSPLGGSSNDGTLVNFGAPPTNWNMDLMDTDSLSMPHGLKFDGGSNQSTGDPPASQHVELDSHVPDFTTMTQGTISLWFRRDAGLGDGAFLGMANDADNSYFRLQFEETPQGATVIRATERIISGGNDDSVEIDAPIDDDGKWHHVTYTSDGTNSKVYVDGVLGATGLQGIFNVPSADFLSLGFTRRANRPLWYYNGVMGDVRVYDEVLSLGQIDYISDPANYGNGLAIPEPGSISVALLALSIGGFCYRNKRG
ncbi:LamG domain-containing protein [Aeoliella sp.]|uniref:LamG domain-containing protein n=1 Tax=Aeoliella sp. TaxID=2795800 RepID=UPI003CCBAC62